MINFRTLLVPEAIVDSLASASISIPTPIQEQTIPKSLEGSDILASANTGTGKTIAYLVPSLNHILNKEGRVLVLAPTRELAAQIKEAAYQIAPKSSLLRTTLLIGGESINKQFTNLRKTPSLIIGTPGRITDHLERGTLSISDVSFLVLDEFDRMLDMGFSEQLEEIYKYLPEQKQTLMFSATMPERVNQLSKKYLTNPHCVTIGEANKPTDLIKQDILKVSESEKFDTLLKELSKRTGSIIIFVKTKHSTEALAQRLKEQDHQATAIHGDLQQNKRSRVISAFREQKFRIMVATDVAARGLDVPHIQHVINYDLPHCPEDYVHRIGRTGRAGLDGQAISFISPQDSGRWSQIRRFLNPQDFKGDDRSSSGSRFDRGSSSSSKGRSSSFSSSSSSRFPKKFSSKRTDSFSRTPKADSFEGSDSYQKDAGSFSDRKPFSRDSSFVKKDFRPFNENKGFESRDRDSSFRPSRSEGASRFARSESSSFDGGFKSERPSRPSFERSPERPSSSGFAPRFNKDNNFRSDNSGSGFKPYAPKDRPFRDSSSREGSSRFSSSGFGSSQGGSDFVRKSRPNGDYSSSNRPSNSGFSGSSRPFFKKDDMFSDKKGFVNSNEKGDFRPAFAKKRLFDKPRPAFFNDSI